MGCGGSKPDAVAETNQNNAPAETEPAAPKLDPKVPFTFREFYTIKNYWVSS